MTLNKYIAEDGLKIGHTKLPEETVPEVDRVIFPKPGFHVEHKQFCPKPDLPGDTGEKEALVAHLPLLGFLPTPIPTNTKNGKNPRLKIAGRDRRPRHEGPAEEGGVLQRGPRARAWQPPGRKGIPGQEADPGAPARRAGHAAFVWAGMTARREPPARPAVRLLPVPAPAQPRIGVRPGLRGSEAASPPRPRPTRRPRPRARALGGCRTCMPGAPGSTPVSRTAMSTPRPSYSG